MARGPGLGHAEELSHQREALGPGSTTPTSLGSGFIASQALRAARVVGSFPRAMVRTGERLEAEGRAA